MPRLRLLAVLSLAAGIGPFPHLMPTTPTALAESAAEAAAEPAAGSAAVARLRPARPAAGRAWIQGAVVDRAGRLRDDIEVAAYAVGRRRGEPVASAITYENPAGGVRHGFFRLYGLEPGRYQVRFSSPGSAPRKARYRTAWTKVVRVGDRDVADLGEVAITLARKVGARVRVGAVGTLRAGRRGSVTVSLRAPEVDPITGTLRVVVDGRRPVKVVLRTRDRGRARVGLPRLSAGRHTVSVTYAGSDAVRATTRPVLTRVRVGR